MDNIFNHLPKEYNHFTYQIKSGLLKRVFLESNVISNYVGFSYNPEISRKFEDVNGRHICLMGIKVFDKGIGNYTEIQVHIMHNLIAGYSTPEIKYFQPDVNRVVTEDFRQIYFGNNDFEKIKSILSETELNLINPSDVYELELNGITFYHLRDLEDGDFIAIDASKRVYKITHDPYNITELMLSLNKVL